MESWGTPAVPPSTSSPPSPPPAGRLNTLAVATAHQPVSTHPHHDVPRLWRFLRLWRGLHLRSRVHLLPQQEGRSRSRHRDLPRLRRQVSFFRPVV